MKLFPASSLIAGSRTRPGYHWALETLIFFAVFFVTAIPEGIVSIIAVLVGPNDPEFQQLAMLFSTAILTILVLIFCRFLQNRKPETLGLRLSRVLPEYLFGGLVGLILIGTAVALCAATGSLRFSSRSFSVGKWILFLLGFLIQGMSEEVLCRGYFMISVARKNAVGWGIGLNAVCFSLLHLANPGFSPLAFCNIVLFGILMSVYVLWRDDLWGVCAIHSIWNFCQGNVFGISVSGTGSGTSPLSAESAAGKHFWNGGAFGIEGGFAVTIMLVLAIVAFGFLSYRKAKRSRQTTDPFPA